MALTAALGCSAPASPIPVQPPPSEPGQPAARDLAIDITEPVSLRAKRMEPSLSPWPAIPEVSEQGPTLAALRRRVERRRRPSERDVVRLATMLLEKADAVGAEQAKDLRLDARGLLRKLSGGKRKLSARARELEAYVEARTGKVARALKIFDSLDERGETSSFALAARVATLLAATDQPVPESVLAAPLPGDAGPGLPYARAWLRMRRHDVRGAYLDLSKAARAWGPSRPAAMVSELILFAALARVPEADLATVLEVGDDKLPELRAELGQAYQRVGEFELAAELDSQLEAEGAAGAELMRRRSDVAYQLGDPEQAAQFLIKATELAAACQEACTELSKELSARALDMARFFHTVYATTQDPRFFEPARVLYARLEATTGDPDVAQQARDLVRHKVGADPGAGIHTKEVLAPFAMARARAIRSCYAVELSRSPTLAGLLVLRWAIDSAGEVKGASSNPPAGEEGLAAVAKCALEYTRAGRFPGRFVRGETRLTMRFELTRDVE